MVSAGVGGAPAYEVGTEPDPPNRLRSVPISRKIDEQSSFISTLTTIIVRRDLRKRHVVYTMHGIMKKRRP
jgi:hypothetical protein